MKTYGEYTLQATLIDKGVGQGEGAIFYTEKELKKEIKRCLGRELLLTVKDLKLGAVEG